MVGWFPNPFEKYCIIKMGERLPQFSDENIKKKSLKPPRVDSSALRLSDHIVLGSSDIRYHQPMANPHAPQLDGCFSFFPQRLTKTKYQTFLAREKFTKKSGQPSFTMYPDLMCPSSQEAEV